MKITAWVAVALWCVGSVVYTWVYWEPDNRAWEIWPFWLQALEAAAVVSGLVFIVPVQVVRFSFEWVTS